MIINSAPQNEAVMSNVGQIGEFRIRNSAKAFNILSSGLYANKVRAIIRELSCNAIDSHVAAKNTNTPFDIHLPNSLEPWFSIRDYGTGLSGDQVTNIYTTYFESTKTESNEFIGALGLGSKSPFSYTDNFTVTAIKDGVKGVYTAFINDQGVPSIALMMDEKTSDPSGVEVKFAVEDRYDFDKFRQEARQVYKYFKQRPVVLGYSDFKFADPEYKDTDIIPGVHSVVDGRNSYAVMGNIAYPIEVPQADKTLGDLRNLLSCGLVIEFGIGELDFQASREGLSYIPQTIESIKRKLELLNAQLAIHLAVEADKITNLWERATYLEKRLDDILWKTAVQKYVVDTKFPLLKVGQNRWNSLHSFELPVKDLESKYNIVIRGFSKARGISTASTLKPSASFKNVPTGNGNHEAVHFQEWKIGVSDSVYFVSNDTKVGALERAKYHWKNNKVDSYQSTVYVVEVVDKTKPMKLAEFYKDLMTPPESRCLKASDLLEKERASNMGANVTIMRLEEGTRRGYRDRAPMVWRDAGKADSFEAKETYYYLPLSAFKNLGIVEDIKSLEEHLRRAKIFVSNIYGVRKNDIEWVRTQKNWVNLDEYVKDKLTKLGQADVMGLVKQSIGWKDLYEFGASKLIKDASSPYMILFNTFKDVKSTDANLRQSLEWLCRQYKVTSQSNIDPSALIDKYTKEVKDLYARYPLLKGISKYSTEVKAIADYITMVDKYHPV